MLDLEAKLYPKSESQGSLLKLDYRIQRDVMFDICDSEGKLLRTGRLSPVDTGIRTTDLTPGKYILLLLDGDRIAIRYFLQE